MQVYLYARFTLHIFSIYDKINLIIYGLIRFINKSSSSIRFIFHLVDDKNLAAASSGILDNECLRRGGSFYELITRRVL